MKNISAGLRNLTMENLREWAGTKILSRGKSYVRNVKKLSYMGNNTLAAWVSGSEEYATTVQLDPDGDFDYSCTCPYDWGVCKHAVAVVLAAAEYVNQKKEIPLLTEDNDLFQALFDDSGDDEEDDDGDDEDEWHEDDDEPVITVRHAAGKEKARLKKIFEGLGKEELVTLLLDLASRYPEIERGVLEKEQLSKGKADKIVSALKREIRELTSQPAWRNHWKGVGNLPDYSHVREQLQALLDNGHADQAIQLGEELWSRGNEQVEQSNDEGDTATEIAGCMEVVLAAVQSSSLPPSKKLQWVIDHTLVDEYSLLESGGDLLESGIFNQADWREVSDVLSDRLKSLKRQASDSFSGTYRRSGLLNMLIKACERSGQSKKIIPLLEEEAEACNCYGKLVEAHLAAGNKDKARQWCVRGFGKTIGSAPGIAAELQGRLRDMAEKEKKHDLVTAYRAEDFFDSASIKSYTELRKASEKAGVWPAVRECALSYLETGRRPDPSVKVKKSMEWPLPQPEVIRPANKAERRYEQYPNLDMLISIAILEKRLDDVVALYQELRKRKRWSMATDKSVAEAVAQSHPQVSLDIWRNIAQGLIGQVKPKAYEEAAIYLRNMCKVYQDTGRLSDWQNFLGELRREHKAKRRLIEVLDGLSGKKITD